MYLRRQSDSLTMMFWGFMSLWTIPVEWIFARASRICSEISLCHVMRQQSLSLGPCGLRESCADVAVRTGLIGCFERHPAELKAGPKAP